MTNQRPVLKLLINKRRVLKILTNQRTVLKNIDQSETSIKAIDQSEARFKAIDQSEASIKAIDHSEASILFFNLKKKFCKRNSRPSPRPHRSIPYQDFCIEELIARIALNYFHSSAYFGIWPLQNEDILHSCHCDPNIGSGMLQ